MNAGGGLCRRRVSPTLSRGVNSVRHHAPRSTGPKCGGLSRLKPRVHCRRRSPPSMPRKRRAGQGSPVPLQPALHGNGRIGLPHPNETTPEARRSERSSMAGIELPFSRGSPACERSMLPAPSTSAAFMPAASCAARRSRTHATSQRWPSSPACRFRIPRKSRRNIPRKCALAWQPTQAVVFTRPSKGLVRTTTLSATRMTSVRSRPDCSHTLPLTATAALAP